MSEPTLEPFGENGTESLEAVKERIDATFQRAKDALTSAQVGERESFGDFLAVLDEAMAGLGAEGQASVMWQKLAINVYAEGLRKFGLAEMKARYQERFGEEDWEFVEGQVWSNFFEGLETKI